MMGMKKFSSGRKQVLNLDGSPNENRPSWKSKYEQICAVHVNNGDPVSPKEEEDERIEPKKSTALIGLSGYHSTESSSDDSDLEDEVRSFLREVDNIYIVERAKPIVKPPTNPTVEKIQKLAKEMQARQNMSAERKGDPAGPKAPTNTTAWQECYDNSTGFTYYWNMETNDVTWDMPLEYQAYVEALKHWQQQQANGVVARMQQARAQHLQQQHQQQQHQQQQIQQKQEIQTLLSLPKPPKEERVFKYCKKKKKDSDDEKIELITSYGPNSGDEDWSDQETSTKKKKDKTDKTEKKSVETSHKTYHHRRKEEPRPIGSLVPYHHDDSESDEPQVSKEDEIKLKLASKIREIQSSDSNSNVDDESAERLKCQDIDSDSESKLKINLKSKITARAKQMATTLGTFENPELSEDSKDKDDFVSTVSNPFSSETNNLIENTSGVGIKRKLKIEIPQPPRKEESPFRDSVKDAEKAKETDGSKRQKIEKIQFIKAETLQPQKEENTAETDAIDIKDVSNLLLDKMKFLSASKDPVSAVQLWTIQLETLVSAWESNDLKRSYISDWLTNTMKELERLESTVAPEGWLCQWQRKEKCYSYTNERTGRVVWEFPQASDMDEKDAEKIGGEEDMEVCTTPPPPSSPPIRDPSPPPPPNISPPTPPPPPSISHPDENPILPPLPPLPPPSEPPTPPPPPPDEPPPHLLMEPLPPGVDAPELLRPMPLEYPVAIPSQIGMHLIPQLHYTLYPQPTLASALALQPRISKSGDLSSELDSFYSDLASLEPAEQPSQPSLPSKESTPPLPQTPTLDTTDAAAKKKKKTKLAPGLALKKKGVSSLVAKWQQVQEDVRRDLKNIDN